ncbi:hypothetical protein ACIA5D_00130 [Actinoplanes sp. NPDC051513]|uniref:hypothetical protein n=1 Tax=Actinoplanes sp. NPDC051513 TaxID=3363908 RepID=UPI0037955642
MVTATRSGRRDPPGIRDTGQVPRVYRADHTAHIRDRLKRQALHFTSGVIMAVLGAITFAVLQSLQDAAPHTLTTVGRRLVILLALVAGLGLLVTGAQYLVYRRRRADLDAAGAEAIGELYARLHRPESDK